MEHATLITLIGLSAATFQSIRIIPQVIKGFRTKRVRDVSVGWIVIGSFIQRVLAYVWNTHKRSLTSRREYY